MMKKICLLVLIMVLGKMSFSQGYPIQQFIGTDSAIVTSKGGLQGRLIPIVITDTNAANAQRMKAYPGAQLYTTNGNFYIRNSNATKWILVSGGNVGPINIYNSDGTLTGNRELDGAGNFLRFNTISEFGVGADSVVFNSPIQRYFSGSQSFILSDSLAKLTRSGSATFLVNSDNGAARLLLNPTGPPDEKKYEIKALNEEFSISQVNDAETTADTIINIVTGGNVGIKRSTPDSVLTVGGGIHATGGLKIDNLISSPGTKALRINAQGQVSIADTTLGGGTVTNVATNNGSGITGGPITTTGTLAIDTTNVIATKASVTGGLAGKLNISDTASMLTPYLRKADTTSMLSPYFHTAGVGLKSAGQTVYADTLLLSTRAWRQKGIDSVVALIAGLPSGTVTSVATNNGTGITGGTITTSGTLAIDTTVISTRAWRQKGVDSLQANINGKLNISDTASMLQNYVNNVGYGLGKTGQTVYADSASLSNYYLRRKDSLTTTNPLGYVTKTILADTAAAIRSSSVTGFVPYTGATQNVDLGQFGLKTKYVEFDTSSQAVTDRRLQWSNDDGTLQFGMTNGGSLTQRIGLEQFARVKNVDAVQINKGQAVYIYGASGDRASVKLADNRNDSTSSKTLGVAAEDIPVNDVGFVGTFGVVSNLNLSTFAPGDILYLDSVPGQLTKTKPQAPYHLVFIGVVERANSGNGLLFVNPQNGYELDELHNVRITSPVPNKAILLYDSVAKLWVDTTVAASGIAVTQVNTNSATGITGGPITTTGTISADTLLLSTRAWRQKGIDSVAALITGGGYVAGNLISGYLTKATGTNSIDTSQLYQSSGLIGIGTTSPTQKLTVNGDALINTLRVGRGGGNLDGNTAFGYESLNANTTGQTNTAIGWRSLKNNTSGSNNISLGQNAMANSTNGNQNIAIGNDAMLNNTSASILNNIAIGYQSLINNTGDNNVAIGNIALASKTTGNQNVALGGQAGYYSAGTFTGGQNVYIGYQAFPSGGAVSNEIAIGSTTTGNGSNSVTLGNASIAKTILRGDVGIGTISPTSTAGYTSLDMRGSSGSYIYLGSGSAALRLFGDGVNGIIDNLSYGSLIFRTNSFSEKMRITNGGNIGIGTSSPDSMLTVNSGTHLKSGVRLSGLPTAPGTKALRIDANGTISTADTLIDAGGTVTSVATNTGTGITGGTITTSGTLAIDTLLISTRAWRQKGIDSVASLINTNVSGTTNYIPKFTSSSAIGNSVIYESGGNIGIGTGSSLNSSPNYTALNINGTTGSEIYLRGSNTDYGYIYANVNNVVLATQTSIPLIFQTNANEKMRLDASGNLGIGTSSPAYKLDVAGTLRIVTPNRSFFVTSNAYSISDGTLSSGIGMDGAGLYLGNVTSSTGWTIGNPQLTLTSSGNLGLGVTPSAWNSAYKTFQQSAGFLGSLSTSSFQLGFNAYYDSSPNWKYVNNDYASVYIQTSGQHIWYNAPSGTAGNAISFTQAMTLDASGNLGIGTTNPTNKLEVDGGSSSVALRVSTTNTGLGVASLILANSSKSAFNDGVKIAHGGGYTNITDLVGTNIMTWDMSNTRVGIGTTSPSRKLSIDGGASTQTWTGYQQNGTEKLVVGLDASGNPSFYGTQANDAIFYTNNSERMRITSGGNVGIGVTSPGAKLEVNGSFRTGGASTYWYTGNDAGGMYLETIGNSTATRVLRIQGINDAGNRYSAIKLQAGAEVISFETADTERMRITSGGDVGIGTTSPGAKLEVNGAIKTAAPSGGTAKPFKIGAAAVVSPTSPNRTIEIEIDGVTYYLSAKTTND